MEKQTFTIVIDAPRERVWEILWGKSTYPQWTSVFAPGSHAETDWTQGSKVLFLDGKGQGMFSSVAENRPPEFMSFHHLGEVHDGREDHDRLSDWSGAVESYTLRSIDGRTELTVEADVTDDFSDYFRETWPKALEKLRAVVEAAGQEATIGHA